MIFDRIFPKPVRFIPANLDEQLCQIPNPCRGWYQIFYFHLPQQPDFHELYWCLRKDETLAMAVVDIGAYRNKALDQNAVQMISQILDFFRQYEMDLILRFVYDCEGNGLLHEPDLFSVIEEHIQQLAPVIHAYTKTIFVLQGLLIGSWGEMHGSKFLSPICMKKLYERIKDAAGENTWLAVRKPVQWRILHNPNERNSKMGLFDDGIFGSETDLGTFGYRKKTETQWEDSWCPQDELVFEESLCRKVPHGGEVVRTPQTPEMSDAAVLDTLRRMHITYLNCVHDGKLLDVWKKQPSPWSNVNLYDYVGAHLGYRICVRNVKLKKKKEYLCVEISIENTGFAPCYEEYSVGLEIGSDNNVRHQETQWDIRSLMPGTVEKWTFTLPVEKGELYLTAQRKKDGRILCFANVGQEYGLLLLGVIK